jgi:hypothetical protein
MALSLEPRFETGDWRILLDVVPGKATDNYIPLLTMTHFLHWICQVTGS